MDVTIGKASELLSFSRPSGGMRINADGKLEWVPQGQMRLDHDPVSGKPIGVLIEEQRTNECLRSQEFENSIWFKTNGAIAPNALAAPDGTITGCKLVEDAANGQRRLYRNTAVLSAAAFTMSVFVHRGSLRRYIMMYPNSGGAGRIATLNLDTLALTGVSNGTISAFAEGVEVISADWVRFWVSVTFPDPVTAINAWIYSSLGPSGNTAYTGDGSSWVGLWGAQVEAGSFPTSYIPTAAAAVTRAADQISLATEPWYNGAEGTILLVGDATSIDGVDRAIFAIDNVTSGQAEQIDYRVLPTLNQLLPRVRNLNVNSYSIVQTFDFAKRAEFRSALALKSGDWASALNGVLGTLSANATPMPVGMARLRFGQRGTGPVLYCGHIRRLQYFPRRLSNAELQQVTA